MNKYAVIESGVVVNIIVWDGEENIGALLPKLVPLPEYYIDIGFIYIDGQFVEPN